MLSKNIEYQSSKIFYRIIGTGKSVLLLHGFGEDGEIWKNQIEFLKPHFQLIIPDLPGSGKSSLINSSPVQSEAVNIGDYAEVIKAILLEENISKCIAIGHSMGGYITLALAEKYPEILTAFGLVHSSAFADSEEKKAARLKSIKFIKNNGAYEFLKIAIPGLFGQYWSKGHMPEINKLIEKGRNFRSEALMQYYNAMITRPDRTEVLKNFSHKILLIIGEYDTAVPFLQSMQQSYLPNQSYIHILRKSAHMGIWEEKDKVNTDLIKFLNWQPD